MGQGLGWTGAATGGGLYQGVEEWMRTRLEEQAAKQGMARRDQLMAQETQEHAWKGQDRAEDQAARAGGQETAQALMAAIDASDLPPMEKLAAKINIMQGKGFTPPEAKAPRYEFAPDGRLINKDDAANLGQSFAKPAEAPRAQPQTIQTDQGIQVIDLQKAIGQTFKPAPDKPTGDGGGRMSGPQEFSALMRLGQTFRINTRAAREIMRQHQLMEDAWTGLQQGVGKGTAEQAIVSTFNKIIDPNSVVREGEYDRTNQGQALLQRMEATARRISDGGLISPAVLRDMVTLSRTYADGAQRYVEQEKTRVKRFGPAFGIDTSLVLAEDEDPAPAGPAAAPAGPPKRRRRYDPQTGAFQDVP